MVLQRWIVKGRAIGDGAVGGSRNYRLLRCRPHALRDTEDTEQGHVIGEPVLGAFQVQCLLRRCAPAVLRRAFNGSIDEVHGGGELLPHRAVLISENPTYPAGWDRTGLVQADHHIMH